MQHNEHTINTDNNKYTQHNIIMNTITPTSLITSYYFIQVLIAVSFFVA